MRVLVDTSAWIDFFNDHRSPEALTLEQLIRDEADIVTCGLIVTEFLQGLQREATLEALEDHFRDMEWLSPREPKTYLSASSLFRQLRSKGITIRSTIDCLIAVLAAESGVLLLSKDRDMTLILESGMLDLRACPLVGR